MAAALHGGKLALRAHLCTDTPTELDVEHFSPLALKIFDPAALKTYGGISTLLDSIVQRVREFVREEMMAPDRIIGMDQVIADAVKLKFIPEPLTAEQICETVRYLNR